jgi:hypothetical protein
LHSGVPFEIILAKAIYIGDIITVKLLFNIFSKNCVDYFMKYIGKDTKSTDLLSMFLYCFDKDKLLIEGISVGEHILNNEDKLVNDCWEIYFCKEYIKLKQDIEDFISSIKDITTEEEQVDFKLTLLNDKFLSSLENLCNLLHQHKLLRLHKIKLTNTYQIIQLSADEIKENIGVIKENIKLLICKDLSIDNIEIYNDTNKTLYDTNLVNIVKHRIFAYGLIDINKYRDKLNEEQITKMIDLFKKRTEFHQKLDIIINSAEAITNNEDSA